MPFAVLRKEVSTIVSQYELHKEHAFDSFCKNVLKFEAFNCYRKISKLRSNEVTFSELSVEPDEIAPSFDNYPFESNIFNIQDFNIKIESEQLVCALMSLPVLDREILLMFWFIGMSDLAISKQLNIPRSTVNYRRQKATCLLKKLMEDSAHETDY